MAKRSFEFNEIVSEKLPEWANPAVRMEKKRLQKRKMNRHFSGWLREVKLLDPDEVKKLASDEGDAAQWRKDHARYVRKALLYEYTFKKATPCPQKLAPSDKTENVVGNTNKSQATVEFSTVGTVDVRTDSKFVKSIGPVSSENSKIVEDQASTDLEEDPGSEVQNSQNQIGEIVEKLVKQQLSNALTAKIRQVRRILKAGILFDVVLENARNHVTFLVDNLRADAGSQYESRLNVLLESGPNLVTEKIMGQIFETPSHKLDDKIVECFSNALLEPITEAILSKHVNADRTIVTTSFGRKEIADLVAHELVLKQEICTIFKVAEEVSNQVAREMVETAAPTLEALDPELKESTKKRSSVSVEDVAPLDLRTELRSFYDNHIAEISKKALEEAKKNLKHLRHPDVARANIDKTYVEESTLEYKKSCHCETDHRKSSCELEKNSRKTAPVPKERIVTAILYPEYDSNLKLVCDGTWKCQAYPIERELRDIPYRFAYAPPRIVNQIKEMKRLKKSDAPIVEKVLINMEKRRQGKDMKSVLKKIINDKAGGIPGISNMAEYLEPGNSILFGSQNEGSSVMSEKQKAPSAKIIREKGFGKPGTAPASSQKKTGPPAYAKKCSRESCIPRAEKRSPYLKHVMHGYQYGMIPVTPCRFHKIKTLDRVLKKFETAGTTGAVEHHLETKCPPVDVSSLRPVPRLVDSYKEWKRKDERHSSLWTRSLNDNRTKRMATYRKNFGQDPVYGFMSNWERPSRRCS
ncbi:Hypothetical protein NTJ_09878 [Nesidiocoris tenuis]|uniref:Uncharacterized protein n=1 Tax=Nesidiocoris tenuis TaxID=355587 RepID=A0ABN7B0G0_9HEMI|nr:Hypothetical protein NTJ_09878 [Nesidiocoris tenuis]